MHKIVVLEFGILNQVAFTPITGSIGAAVSIYTFYLKIMPKYLINQSIHLQPEKISKKTTSLLVYLF